jgi:hypothetical protein
MLIYDLRACGDEKHLRKLFGRALNSTRDWPEGIAEAWTAYEREQGCLDSFEFCLEKIDERYSAKYSSANCN